MTPLRKRPLDDDIGIFMNKHYQRGFQDGVEHACSELKNDLAAVIAPVIEQERARCADIARSLGQPSVADAILAAAH